MTARADFGSLGAFVDWLAAAPAGTSLDAGQLLETLKPLATVPTEQPALAAQMPVQATWRERLWSAPADARIGVTEAAEALGKSASWIYREMSRKTIPHYKTESRELVFVVGELRTWLRGREEMMTPALSRPRLVSGARP